MKDTDSIFIPSVYIARASFLALRDMLESRIITGDSEGLWIEIGEAEDEGG